MLTNAPTPAYPWRTIAVNPDVLLDTLHRMQAAGVRYGLGAKAPSLDDAPGTFPAVDCSGFVRYAVWQASQAQAGGRVELPDGSVTQHELCRVTFKPCDKADLGDDDGVLRIAFLSPAQTSEGIGHVMLVYRGRTLESHGGHGPDSRAWGSQGFMALCSGYVLQLAGEAA